MLNAAKGCRWREGPLAEINTREELEAWLRKQPREVAVALAARAALRVLPIVWTARDEGFRADLFAGIVLPLFRATGVAWVPAKYPVLQATEFRAFAGAAAHAAAAAADAFPAHADTAYAAFAAASDAAYAAAFAAADGAIGATRAARAAARAADAATGAASTAYWSAISIDATRMEEGASASVIASAPLWPQGQPDQLRSLWQEMKTALFAAKQGWEVWTNWYDGRLDGRVRGEELELAYVRIEAALWGQGPAIVNAKIKARIEALERSPRRKKKPKLLVGSDILPTLPAPIENVPSPVSFGWSSQGTVTVVLGELNWPAFPFKGGEEDHKHCLEACRTLATDIARKLQQQKWNVRDEYKEALADYAAYLPNHPEEGNFVLADAQARIIRHLFAKEEGELPFGFKANLKVFLEQHIGLRAYYPAIPAFYQRVRSGHLEQPLPIDAFDGFLKGVQDNTPTLFEPNVAGTLQGIEKPVPNISAPIMEASKSTGEQLAPPPDPLGEVDLEKSRQFTLASGVNDLCKVVSEGEKVGKNIEGWNKAIGTLEPYAAAILEWLRIYLGN